MNDLLLYLKKKNYPMNIYSKISLQTYNFY
jgi:hypothetical protein